MSGASVLDVAPTILYLMGLPVARDMQGRVLTEIVDDSFARLSPVTFIPSYESLAVKPATRERRSRPPACSPRTSRRACLSTSTARCSRGELRAERLVVMFAVPGRAIGYDFSGQTDLDRR